MLSFKLVRQNNLSTIIIFIALSILVAFWWLSGVRVRESRVNMRAIQLRWNTRRFVPLSCTRLPPFLFSSTTQPVVVVVVTAAAAALSCLLLTVVAYRHCATGTTVLVAVSLACWRRYYYASATAAYGPPKQRLVQLHFLKGETSHYGWIEASDDCCDRCCYERSRWCRPCRR